MGARGGDNTAAGGETGPRARDLGIKAGTKGDYVAHIIKANGNKMKDAVQHWHVHECTFQFALVLNGWAEFEYEGVGVRRIDAGNQLKALFPQLAEEWHPTRNAGIKPYEFAPYSNELVWWHDASGDQWQARIKDRVLEATALRADGDATPCAGDYRPAAQPPVCL